MADSAAGDVDGATAQGGSCPQCKTPFTASDRFCRNCGSQLRDDTQTIDIQLARVLPGRIDAAIKARFHEQKLVEIETAQQVAERAMGWLKTVGFFVGIPLLVCGIALSLFGIKTYSDLQTAAEKAAKLENVATGAEKQMEAAKKRIDDIDTSLKTAQARIESQLTQINSQQKRLQAEVQSIQERLSFCPSKSLSPEAKAAIQDKLTSYIAHLQTIGFPNLDDRVSVCVFSKEEPQGLESTPLNAYYNVEKRVIYIHKDLLASISVPLREYSHYALGRAAPKAKIDEENLAGMEQGLTDYFPMSFLDTPLVGDGLGAVFKIDKPYLRNLANDLKYAAADAMPHSRGEVWAGALWRCRAELGREVVDKIALKAWSELTNAADTKSAGRSFTALLEKHEREAVPAKATSCLAAQATQRGLPR